MADYDTSESLGEVAIITPSLPIGLSRAEIDMQIATAHQYPRDVSGATRVLLALATMDEDTATECMYSLPPRGDKKDPIEGPSARFAELLAQVWGNNRVSAEVIEVNRDGKFVVCRGVYHDLEANSARAANLRANIQNSKGRLYKPDMINMTSNALCSKALRNAVLAGIPKAFWRRAYEAARNIVKGDPAELEKRRTDALRAFDKIGVTREQLFDVLGIGAEADIDGDKLVTLRGMYSAIKSGEETAERMFGPRGGLTHDVVQNPLSSSAQEAPQPEGEPATDTAQGGNAAPAPDAIAVARQRGAEAKTLGLARKAIPGEYRAADRKPEAEAWQAGWDSAEAPAK